MRITPSILNANFARVGEEIARVPSADGIHLDVMDNHFVPNLTFGLPVVEAVRQATDQMLDIHLMIEDPDRWAPPYAEVGAESVTFHIEAAHGPVRLARELHRLGSRVGVALNPATSVSTLSALLGEIDMVTVMSVEPGFGGQPFLDLVLPKVAQIRSMISKAHVDIWVQMDGGITVETIERCVEAGADTFVAGAAVYKSDDPDAMVRNLHALAQGATHHPELYGCQGRGSK
ncbi:MAG: ribulose-phosphate 3-epimerase [Propionibacteriaceae bacterium]|nr:ribulose-phosphate 3-epimerase [Propionibacteriaceae bacterium]